MSNSIHFHLCQQRLHQSSAGWSGGSQNGEYNLTPPGGPVGKAPPELFNVSGAASEADSR